MASEKNAVSGGADPAGWIGKGFAVRGIDPVAHGGKRADEAARSRKGPPHREKARGCTDSQTK